MQLVIYEDTVGDLYESMITDLPLMMHHVNIKRIQQQDFEVDKASPKSKRTIQIDFAKSCKF